MKLINIDRKLSHLNEKQIKDLIMKYYSGDKVSHLINDYNINMKPHSFYKVLPNITFKNKVCPYCKSQIIIEPRVRCSKDNILKKIKCNKCNHLLSDPCNCKNCQLERKKKDALNRKNLLNKYSRNVESVSYKSLTLYECVFLSVYLSKYYDYKARITRPLFYELDFYNTNNGLLFDKSEAMLFQLFNKNILLFYSCYFTSSYPELLENGTINISYMSEMRFTPNLVFNSNILSKYTINSTVNKIMNLDYNLLKHHSLEDFTKVWQDIALVELKFCLVSELKNFHLNQKVTIEKCDEILKDMLRVFSTAQCYTLIFKSIDIAFSKYFNNILSSKEAAHSVVNILEKEYKKALLINLNIPSYINEEKRLRSPINKLFLNDILKANSLDLIMIPNETNMKLLIENING